MGLRGLELVLQVDVIVLDGPDLTDLDALLVTLAVAAVERQGALDVRSLLQVGGESSSSAAGERTVDEGGNKGDQDGEEGLGHGYS